ncbi:MAG: RHS repeat-associated core domain-containing protein, partial [Nitrosopumilus sp.]|nr:RHS repeat-associated core domain-containing protein [Nitrosopumilus sp.]
GVRVRTSVTPPAAAPVVTDYLVDTSGALSHVVAETDATGELQAYYVRGDDLLAVVRPVGLMYASRWYHADGLGSVRRLTDETGAVTDTYTYSAFGERLEHTGTDPQPYAFTGEPLDLNVGWQYHRARWMDPGVGRFAGMDPFEGTTDAPLSLHKYGYAAQQPVTRVDPTGLFGAFSIGAMAVVVALIPGGGSVPVWTPPNSGYLSRRLEGWYKARFDDGLAALSRAGYGTEASFLAAREREGRVNEAGATSCLGIPAFACTYFGRYEMFLTSVYFNGTSTALERAFVLHHEYPHWFGRGEHAAYSKTWPHKKAFGWGTTEAPNAFWRDMTTLARDHTNTFPWQLGVVTQEEWDYATGARSGPMP